MKRILIALLFASPLAAQTPTYQISTQLQFWQPNPMTLTVAAGTNLACVAFAELRGGTGAPTLLDSAGDKWTLGATVNQSPKQAAIHVAFYDLPCKAGTHNLTISQATTAPTSRNAAAAAYSNVLSFDKAVQAGLGNSLYASISGTASANELLVASFTETGPFNPTETSSAGFVLRQNVYYGALALEDSVAPAGSYLAGLVFTNAVSSPDWTAMVLAFQSTPAGSTGSATYQFIGALRNCKLCDGTDDVSAPVNVFTGSQIQILQDTTSLFKATLDANGNLTATAVVQTSLPSPLNFKLKIFDPSGNELSPPGLAVGFDPLLLAGQGTFKIIIRIDSASGKLRGTQWNTGP